MAWWGVWCPGANEASQESQAQKLVAQLRDPRLAAENRRKIFDELLELGEPGPRRLAAYATREFGLARTAYLSQLEKAASAAMRARIKPGLDAEVETLRSRILALPGEAGLSKEMIVQRGDPALRRLQEILLVSDDDVFAAAPALREQRQALLDLAEVGARALEKIPEARRKLINPLPPVKQVEAELSNAQMLAALAATPMKPADRRTLSSNIPLAQGLDPEEAAGIMRLNQIRIILGLDAQEIDPRLCHAARDHSRSMAELHFFDHKSPVPGQEDPWKRAKRAGTTASAENIAQGPSTGADAIMGWWHSPGHFRNMLARHRRTGLGRYQGYWTQMFGD